MFCCSSTPGYSTRLHAMNSGYCCQTASPLCWPKVDLDVLVYRLRSRFQVLVIGSVFLSQFLIMGWFCMSCHLTIRKGQDACHIFLQSYPARPNCFLCLVWCSHACARLCNCLGIQLDCSQFVYVMLLLARLVPMTSARHRQCSTFQFEHALLTCICLDSAADLKWAHFKSAAE